MTIIKQRPAPLDAIETLQSAGFTPLIARLFAARGVDDVAKVAINLSQLLPPNTLTNNQQMAKLLADAIGAQKKLLVIGDFLRS